MQPFVTYGHDNNLSFFRQREDVQRCTSCGLLAAKWEESLSEVRIPRLRFDISCSYDGILVVSSRFRDLYEAVNMTGLDFVPLASGFFSIRATQFVQFDAKKRGTRFVDKCPTCDQYESVVGAAPAFLKDGTKVDALGFARTDLEFGSADEKAPLLICGGSAAEFLGNAELKGLDLELVRS